MQPWIETIFSFCRDIVVLAALEHPPKPILIPIKRMLAWAAQDDLEKDRKFSADRVERRMKMGATRNDFTTPILKKQGDRALTRPEIESSFNILVVAGTTSFLLLGV